MKLFTLFLFLSFEAVAVKDEGQCIPPSQPFVEEKLRTTYQFSQGERELKDIVSDGKNQALREEVQSLKRRLMFAKRKDVDLIKSELQVKYEQMLSNSETEKEITNFPTQGASSVVTSSSDGFLKVSMNNLIQNDLDFLPPETLKKLGKNVSIAYKYPYDSFDYFLTFEGQELPMQAALQRVMNEFEDACILRLKENQRIRTRDERDARAGASAQ